MATLTEVMDEVFDGKADEVMGHIVGWAETGKAQNIRRTQLLVLCYIAWKLELIEEHTAAIAATQ